MTAASQQERATLTAWRRRTDMTLRVIAAVPLGYAVGSLWAMALARIIPGDRAEATVAAMWSFFARSGWRAVWTLVVLGGVAAAITAASIALTGRL